MTLGGAGHDHTIGRKMGVEADALATARETITGTTGEVIVIFGGDLSLSAQAVISASAGSIAGEGRRVLLHPLAKYNNSVGAHDMMPGRKTVDEVVSGSTALLIGGSLQDASVLAGKDFVAVQELFLTATTEHADVVFPAASFAEMDGTYTNNAGNVQRVRKSIEPLHRSKADWTITSLLARDMGVDLGYDFSASNVFKTLADATPAYTGFRYPSLKDESNPVQANYSIGTGSGLEQATAMLERELENMPDDAEMNNTVPRIGHKLHRLTVMTSKTPQFHLLAHGNPKPANLMVSPLLQFELDGEPNEEGKAEAAAVGISDRTNTGGR